MPPAAPVAAPVVAMPDLRLALLDALGVVAARRVKPLVYSASLTTAKGNALGANGSTSLPIQIDGSGDFVALLLTGASSGRFLLSFRTGAGDQALMNEPVHSSAIVGTAERPYRFPRPLLIPANATLVVDFADLSGAPNEVYLSFHGYSVRR